MAFHLAPPVGEHLVCISVNIRLFALLTGDPFPFAGQICCQQIDNIFDDPGALYQSYKTAKISTANIPYPGLLQRTSFDTANLA